MSKLIIAAAAAWLMAGATAAQTPDPGELNLVCEGTATSGVDAARTVSRERVRVQVKNYAGRVKLPQSLLPPVNEGNGDGWFRFSTVSVTDKEVRGRVSLNLLNETRVVIDRMTGDIDLRGLGASFSGTCEKAADDAAVRKF